MRRFYKLVPILVAIPVYSFCKGEEAKGWNLYVWGSGRNGELGLGIESNKPVPTLLQGLKFKQVSARKAHSAGITPDGKLYTWGNSRNGVLGHESSNLNVLVPKQVQSGEHFKQVSCGYQHMCAVTNHGEVYVWGNVEQQEVKFRSIGTVEQDRKVPEHKIRKVDGLSRVKEVACSAGHTVALTEEGKLFTWGNRKTIGRDGNENTPMPLNDLPEIEKIACGIDFTIALDKKGKLWAWGSNGFGQLGIPSLKSTNAPHIIEYLEQQEIVDISCGDNFAGAITKSGQVFTWGFGNEGQLGHGDKFDQTIPRAMNFDHSPVQISCGGAHTALLTKNNELYVFGRGREGQIGVEEKAESNTAQKNKPRFVESLKGIIIYKIVCGGNHTMALTS